MDRVRILKELKEITGCGLIDCKNAMDKASDDFEKAVSILRNVSGTEIDDGKDVKENNFLNITECIIYETLLEHIGDYSDPKHIDKSYEVRLCITNQRIIWIIEGMIFSAMLRSIEFCHYIDNCCDTVFGDYSKSGVGTGDFAVCVGGKSWEETFLFFSEDVCKNVYKEIIRGTFEN